jgi:excisionase family DNA binding protein
MQVAFEPLLPLNEVARQLAVSRMTVRRLIDRGLIQTVNIGARVMVSAHELSRLQRDGVGTPRKVGRPRKMGA